MPRWTHECVMNVQYQTTRQCSKDNLGWTAYWATTVELYGPIDRPIKIVSMEISAELRRIARE